MRNVLEYFEQGALVKCPDKIAIVHAKGTTTFRELKKKASVIANYVTNRFDAFNVPIAIYLPKSEDTVAANLGVLYSGNVYMNLDTNSPIERTEKVLKNIQPAVLLTSSQYFELLKSQKEIDVTIINIDEIFDEYKQQGTEDSIETNQTYLNLIDTDPLCIINTSGSTGIPKGVALTHRGVIDFITQVTAQLDLSQETTIGSLAPLYFDIYILELFICLYKGSTLVLLPENLAAFPAKLIEQVSDSNVDFIFWVPTIMVNISNLRLLEQYDLKQLKHILFAGEVFPIKHFNYWKNHIPGATYINMYGPIEITVDCLFYVVDRDFDLNEVLPIGKPFDNTGFFILDDDGTRVATGEQGELYIRGSSLALGYWNDPEKTKQAFVQNPLHHNYADIVYKTGDLVKQNEYGEVVFVGRKDFQIKHSGYRIELGEIENVILSIDEIKNACVLYNKEKKEIVLCYETNITIDVKQIRVKLSRILPKYMIPSMYFLLESLPRNANGKIDRKGLELLWK